LPSMQLLPRLPMTASENLDDIIRRYEKIRVLSDKSNAEYLGGLLRVLQRLMAQFIWYM
jgi:hypothetical protein